MRIGQFDADSKALARRIETQSKLGKLDLNDWIFDIIDVCPGMNILDLGCGTGKQSVEIAKRAGEGGSVLSMDVSQESLSVLEERARREGIEARIRTVRGNLDDLPEIVLAGRYDRIIASYSLYYVQDANKLLSQLARILDRDRVLFFCGPGYRNNWEIRSLIARITKTGELQPTVPATFMERTAPEILRDLFQTVSKFEFENPIDFDSVEALHKYWSSHNLYDTAFENAFLEEVGAHFQKAHVFSNVKRAIGWKASGRL